MDNDAILNGWIDVSVELPTPNETVWLTDGKMWVALGCLVDNENIYCWASSNGFTCIDDGKIEAECEIEDLDVKYWHRLPKLPFK